MSYHSDRAVFLPLSSFPLFILIPKVTCCFDGQATRLSGGSEPIRYVSFSSRTDFQLHLSSSFSFSFTGLSVTLQAPRVHASFPHRMSRMRGFRLAAAAHSGRAAQPVRSRAYQDPLNRDRQSTCSSTVRTPAPVRRPGEPGSQYPWVQDTKYLASGGHCFIRLINLLSRR